MKLTPVFTERSTKDAKEGKYTFWVLPSATKTAIKEAVKAAFGVDVVGVRTVNYKGSTKRDWKGKTKTIRDAKKALVEVKQGQKIEVFEEEKKAKKKGTTKK